MTDEENKRQRHLAEMMIAQCDGRAIEIRRFYEYKWKWEPAATMVYEMTRNMTTAELADIQFRIKPEPREWWFCLRCKVTTPADRLAPHHAMACIESDAIKVREVLND